MFKETTDQTKSTVVYTYAAFDGPKELRDKMIKTSAKNMKIVFYNPEDKYPVKSFCGVLPRRNKTNGNLFFGINGSKYGVFVPKDATHLAIATFGKAVIEKLYSIEIPNPYSKITITLGKDTNFVMTVRRSAKNIFITFGDIDYRKQKVKNTKTHEKHKAINQQWVQLN